MFMLLNENMVKITLLVIIAFGLIMEGHSASMKRKRTFNETWRFDRRLGIHIASDTLIQQYENEHKMMYKKEDGTIDEVQYSEWLQKLGDKNLTEYCAKYLKATVPKRNVCNMFAEFEPGLIRYFQIDDGVEHKIGAIRCEVPFNDPSRTGKCYYITEAPEKECVYSLMRIKMKKSPYKIVFKICGFESNDAPNFIYSTVAPKDRKKFMSKTHRGTGVHIAPDDLIAEYEKKHQEMYKKSNGSIDKVKYKFWPSNRNKTYLTDFCMKYLQAVVPNRARQDGLYGEAGEIQLMYTQKDYISFEIGIIKCHLPASARIRNNAAHYYITQSPEPDCVYTLLRTTAFPICKIVHQICSITIDDGFKKDFESRRPISSLNYSNELECKPSVSILGNVEPNNQSVGTEK